MTSPAAMQADYVDLKFVKGRKVLQVVLELPIEAGEAFVKTFGTPNPATGVPVALARLESRSNYAPKALNAVFERKGGKLAQRAGILCGEGAFQRFILDKYGNGLGVDHLGTDETVEFVRQFCDVKSRADLDHNEEAARKFLDLEASYKAWLTVAA